MTSPTPAPVPTGATYSTANPEADLNADLHWLWMIGKDQITDYVDELVDALDKISDALQAIELNWVGDSQKAAADINDRWKACATSLFGTKKNPELGVLIRLGAGIQGAAINYDMTEKQIVAMWQQYIDLLNQLLAGQQPSTSGDDGQQSQPIVEV
jgi:hypothetical protein